MNLMGLIGAESSAIAASASIKVVQKTTPHAINATGSNSVSWNSATTAGNLLVAVISNWRGMAAGAVTPPSGLGWTLAKSISNGTVKISIYYSPNAASQSGSQTWTVGTFKGGGASVVQLFEISGVVAGGTLEQTASNTGSSTSLDSGTTGATTHANSYVMAAFGFTSSSPTLSSPTNGFTIEAQNNTYNSGFCSSDSIVSSTGAQNTGVTASGTTAWAGVIATFY